MYDPNFQGYNRTPEGEPEYSSILITLDAKLANLPGPLVVQKMVLGSESPAQALINLLDYYGQKELANRESTFELLMAAGRCDDPVFIYTNEVNTELVMSTNTYTLALTHPEFGRGSMLVTNEKLQEIAARTQQQQLDQHGGFSPLAFAAFEVGPREPEAAGAAKAAPEA